MVVIAVGGISHETNTFATRTTMGLTQLAAFKKGGFMGGMRTGDEIVTSTGKGGGYLGGLCDAARGLGYELKGLLMAGTQPSGTIADAAYVHPK